MIVFSYYFLYYILCRRLKNCGSALSPTSQNYYLASKTANSIGMSILDENSLRFVFNRIMHDGFLKRQLECK